MDRREKRFKLTIIFLLKLLGRQPYISFNNSVSWSEIEIATCRKKVRSLHPAYQLLITVCCCGPSFFCSTLTYPSHLVVYRSDIHNFFYFLNAEITIKSVVHGV
jgi:hypothetical protein